MKRMIVAVAGTVALMSGSAYAGGCNYGSHAMAEESEPPVLAAADDASTPELLAKLKLKKETEALEKLIETPVIHN